jgi:Holliday junction resolvase RusA-like endonuclease
MQTLSGKGIDVNDPVIVFESVVIGLARPAGSKRAFVPTNKKTGQPFRRPNGGVVVSVVDDNPKSKDWKTDIKAQIYREWNGRELLDGPLWLRLVFYLPRPQSHFGSGKNAGTLRATAPTFPATKPDVLKLARGVEDALTNIVWKDDSRIVKEILEKEFTVDLPRVVIQIGTL